jgi:CMP-2-keto-3-deoxyoctulosonic acid synthetase
MAKSIEIVCNAKNSEPAIKSKIIQACYNNLKQIYLDESLTYFCL